MKKYIAWTLILVTLLLAACQPVGTQPTEPDNIVGTAPPTTQPADSQPAEPKPTESLPTEPEHTQPKPEIPEGFPDDIDTDPATVTMFQELFGDNSWYAQGLYIPYDEPRNADIRALFNGGFSDESSVTDAERDEIVKIMNSEHYYDLDMFRLPIDKMNAVLQAVFGLALDDINVGSLKYLESTNCYYIVGGGSKSLGEIHIVGTKRLDTGNIELYYQTTDPAYKGVAILKPAEDGYHIVSNRWFE